MTGACAIIVAGGVGSRFGNPGGKQLVPVAGKPVLTWSVLAFDASDAIDSIVVVCPAEKLEQIRQSAIEPYALSKPVNFALAGDTRQASVLSGLDAVPAGTDIVAIHDGARPCIRTSTIDEAIRAFIDARKQEEAPDGMVCGYAAVDTVKSVHDGLILETPPRSSLWCAQTPQIFDLATVRRAHELSLAQGFAGTDDSSLMERAGGAVMCFDAPRDNIKVTVPEDLPMVEFLLSRRDA